MKKERRLTARNYLISAGVALLEPILLTIAGVGSGSTNPDSFRVETIPLKLPRLPRKFSGLRVAHISDIHMGGWMNLERLQLVGSLIIAERPDILVITGDFVIGSKPSDVSQQMIQDLITGLSQLAAQVSTFAVLGNHDYWTDVAGIRYALAASGIRELTNTVSTLRRENENLHICGVDDIWEGQVRLDEVISRLDDDSAAILLAHEPDFADTSAATGRFDLQLSGHSHGGQVVLPLLGAPILPYLGRKYPLGLYRVGEMLQYTNRGLGTGRLAIRINCPPEVAIFVLESTTS